MSKPKNEVPPAGDVQTAHFDVDSNDLALKVFGPAEEHLRYIEQNLQISIKSRGNNAIIEGSAEAVQIAYKCLLYLVDLARTTVIKKSDVADCLRASLQDNKVDLKHLLSNQPLITYKKKVFARTFAQRQYIQSMLTHDVVFGVGPAGTGKTYLAMAAAVAKMMRGEIERIILTRPAVEAGEKLGFLPGDLAEKVNPYLRPLFDALYEMVDEERATRMITTGQVEVAPIAFMRGRTLSNCFVILDEAQNCTREQMKMFLTRLGDNSRAVITGDLTQIDLPKDVKSGLIQAVKILNHIPGISIHAFSDTDVVRHPLVAEIVRAYDRSQRIP